jgi:hypothetical protein
MNIASFSSSFQPRSMTGSAIASSVHISEDQ